MRPRALAVIVLAAAVVGSAGAALALRTTSVAAVPINGDLAAIIAGSHDLGPAAATERIVLNLGLTGRNGAGLSALIAHGERVTSAEYAQRFGPDPAAVAALSARLRGFGLHVSWEPGSPIIAVDGSPSQVGALLSVSFHDYDDPADGRRFYAAVSEPHTVAWMRGIVSSISGLDNFARVAPQAVHPKGSSGLSPDDVSSFYNFTALHNAGLDGSGVTVLLPDAPPGASDLAAYATKYHLPPFALQVIGDPTPPASDTPGYSESVMDVDIVHAMAPQAKLIVYNSPASDSANSDASIVQYFIRVNDKMVSDHFGNIVSESLAWCAMSFDNDTATQLDSVLKRGAAEGMTFLASSGDEGGYGCVRLDGDQHRVSVMLPAASPNVTSVGGTTVFLGDNSTYFKETAWGNALSWNASGGGLSAVYPRAAWQTGPGVINATSNGMRQVPDVAGLADENTAWDLALGGKFCACGAGTSAAAPLWAGFITLLDQDLAAKGLRGVGFANPAIYNIGQRNDQLPGPPFHAITQGNNLVYTTSPGWNYATGWGSMNAGALASAWEDYIQGGGA